VQRLAGFSDSFQSVTSSQAGIPDCLVGDISLVEQGLDNYIASNDGFRISFAPSAETAEQRVE
jgi:hypothetical protein